MHKRETVTSYSDFLKSTLFSFSQICPPSYQTFRVNRQLIFASIGPDTVMAPNHSKHAGKRALQILELLDSSSEDEPSTPSRRDALGRHMRRGGWDNPTARQKPDGVGMAKWRHEWETSKLWKLLERQETYDERGYWGVVFRRRTSCPRVLFDQLVAEVKSYPEVKTHQSGDGVRAPPTIPVELKVAAALSFMRMGGLLQIHADYADIDVETLRRFIKSWTTAVVRHEYGKHVYAPEVGSDEFKLVQYIHTKLGFPGCIGMTDGVHVDVDQVPWSLINAHQGKEGHPTRAFNVTGDCRRIIHYVHRSHAGVDNDKTLAQHDEHMQRIKNRELYADVEFDLLTGADGSVEKHRGGWLLTDNGYHAWRVLQYPPKVSDSLAMGQWGRCAESIRKPGSECIFGICKKRYHKLKDGWTFGRAVDWGKACVEFDNIFFVTCMLHNRLLRHDGLDDIGKHESDYKRVTAKVDRSRVHAAGGLHAPANAAGLYADAPEEGEASQYDPAHDSLFKKLVGHFQIAWGRREVKWLRTAKDCRRHGVDTRELQPYYSGGTARNAHCAGGYYP